MEFLFIIGGIAYYIYKVYQETQKRNNQSTTPINRNKPISNTNTNRPERKTTMQSIEDMLKELEKQTKQATNPPAPKKETVKPIVQSKPKVNKPAKSTLDTLNYDDVLIEEGQHARLVDKYKTILDLADEIREDNIYDLDEIEDYDKEDHKHSSKKMKELVINGNSIKAKDAFVYSLIFDKKY